jgi:hypothetical protein
MIILKNIKSCTATDKNVRETDRILSEMIWSSLCRMLYYNSLYTLA